MKRPLPTLAITGGTGFVGSTLVRHAVMRGHNVRALTRRPQGTNPKIKWIDGALDRPDALAALLDGADAVIHVAGATKGMDVTWNIEPLDGGCRVTIEHRFQPRLPGFAAIVDQVFTRPIAGRTLATFKALAEALADESGPAGSPAAKPAAGAESPGSDTPADVHLASAGVSKA